MTTVRIASVPSREDSLRKTIASIKAQFADRIFVCLNGYDHVPDFLDGCDYILSDNEHGDAGRYLGVENDKGYIFTIDDDLIYPRSYLSDMIFYVDKFKCPITLHGKSFANRPIENFFQSATKNYSCLSTVWDDAIVDIGGTGVMVWKSDMLKISIDDFKLPNMADIWFSKLCHDQNKKILLLRHDEGYIKYMPQEVTLWSSRGPAPYVQTDIVNSFLKPIS